jgi:hypothetical protein
VFLDKREMEVSARGPQTHFLILIFKKRQQRFAQVGLCCLRNDLCCGRTNRPIVVVKGPKKQVTRFQAFRSTQEKEHFGAVR